MTHVLPYIFNYIISCKTFRIGYELDVRNIYDITIFYIKYKRNLTFINSANLLNCNYDSIVQNSNFTHREIVEQIEEVDLVDLDVASALL